jgi:hypothetical protein
MADYPVIESKATLEITMTSEQAEDLLEKLKDPHHLKELLGPELKGLGHYGVHINNERLLLEGSDEPPHDPPFQAPSEDLVKEVSDAIQRVITKFPENPPMFAICSRIAVVAYTAAATPPSG